MTKVLPAIYERGHFTPDQPLELREHQRVFLIVSTSQDDVPSLAISKLAENDKNFPFLNNPAEDVYTIDDGNPV